MGASDRFDQAFSHVCLAYLLQILRFPKKKKNEEDGGRGGWEVEGGVAISGVCVCVCVCGGGGESKH